MHSPLADSAAASSPPASSVAVFSLNASMQRASGRPLCGVQLCDSCAGCLSGWHPKLSQVERCLSARTNHDGPDSCFPAPYVGRTNS